MNARVKAGRLVIMLALLAGGLGQATARAQSQAPTLDGVWAWTSTTPDGQAIQTTMTLRKADSQYTGSIVGPDGRLMPIRGVTLTGSDVRFQIVATDPNGNSFSLPVTAKLSGQTLTGTLTFGDPNNSRSIQWRARRIRGVVDPSGVWRRVSKRDRRSHREFILTLKMQDGHPTGTLVTEPDGSTEPLLDLKLVGDTISFKTPRARGQQESGIEYEGKIKGDDIKGIEHILCQGDPHLPWELKRDRPKTTPTPTPTPTPAPPTATGTWQYSMDMGNGQTVQRQLQLVQSGNQLVGVAILGDNQTPISNGMIQNGALSFSVVISFNGNTLTSNYSGVLSGDSITGMIETSLDNGQTQDFSWTAQRVSR